MVHVAHPTRTCWWRVICLAFVGCFLAVTQARADEPVVAVAANLRFALTQLADAFAEAGNGAVRLSFGSSGNIRRQISQGAPFELFLSADEFNVLELSRSGLTEGEGVVFAEGRLVFYVPPGSPLVPDAELAGLHDALTRGELRRFAIANPEHAPFGLAAREILENLGLWVPIQPFLVIGENAGQAAQFAASGSTDGGLIPYSLVSAPDFTPGGNYVTVPEKLHSPLHQRMVLMKGASETARRFYQFLQSPDARAVFNRFGMTEPGSD